MSQQPKPTTPTVATSSESSTNSTSPASQTKLDGQNTTHIGLPTEKHQWTTGRAPWWGVSPRPFIIGVTGGSASGKTSVCEAIVQALNLPWVGLLSMDRYYKVLAADEIAQCKQGLYNFDHPDAFDVEQLYQDLYCLQQGKAVDVPIYDFVTHSRSPQTDRMYGVDIVLVEGILLFYSEKVRNLCDLKIYVDTDNDLRLARRLKRDIVERGRSVENVLEQYQRTVKPSFEQFIQPTKRFADLIIPWNAYNNAAIDILYQHIAHKLADKQKHSGIPQHITFTEPAASSSSPAPFATSNTSVLINSPSIKSIQEDDNNPQEQIPTFTLGGNEPLGTQSTPTLTTSSSLPSSKKPTPSPLLPRDSNVGFSSLPAMNEKGNVASPITEAGKHPTTRVTILGGLRNLHLLPQTNSMIAIHTTLRDGKTEVDEFRFALSRLVRILSAEAMNLVTYQPMTVVTPTGEEFHGLQCSPDEMVAVSIVRAGEAFEHPVRDVIKDISIGKIVIQHHTDGNDKKTGPRLYYARLPPVVDRKILLFDGVLSTGSAVIMAIHVLLDHGVKPENIIFCCLAAAPEGIYAVSQMFPQLQIVTSAIEHGLDDFLHAVPGVAYVADRWFGTMKTSSSNRSFGSNNKSSPQHTVPPESVAIDDAFVPVIGLDP